VKSLLKFGTTEDRARELVEICKKKGYVLQHKNHQKLLTESIIKEGGFTVNFGGYGSYSRLGLGNNFGTKWEISGLDAAPSKGFTDVEVCFGGGVDPEKEKAISTYIGKQGGSVSKSDKGGCDLCIVASSNPEEPNLLETMGAMVEGAKGFLIIPLDEFLAVIPAIKKPKAKAAPAAKLSDELKETQKKLQERDFDLIDEVLKSLQGRDEDIDLLVQNVSVDPETGELDRGSKFKGTGPALRFLDVALMGLLSMAAETSHAGQLRKSIKKLSFGLKKLPVLHGFTALEELEIEIDRVEKRKESSNVDDLTCLGSLPSLRSLKIANEAGYDQKGLRLKSLKGLIAPKLESISCSNVGLVDISALLSCPELMYVDLSGNNNLSDLTPVSGATKLEKLMINGTGVSDLEFLKKCLNISEINLYGCEKLRSLNGLRSPSLEALELPELNLDDLSGTDTLLGLKKLDLSGLHRVRDLSQLAGLTALEELEIYNLPEIKSLQEMSALTSLQKLRIRGCSGLKDVSNIEQAASLEEVSIEECTKVTKGPDEWPESLKNLSLAKTGLREIGRCPAQLTEINIQDNPKLLSLKGLSESKNIRVNRWGLNLSGCFSLSSLEGLAVESLEEILIPETLSDLDALAEYPRVKITVVAGKGEQKGYSTIVDDIPAELGKALNKLGITELNVRTDWGGQLRKLTGIGSISTLKVLDLSGCNIDDITAIAALENLELLRIQPRTELSKKFGKATFDTKGQVDKLRLKLLAGL